MVTPAAPAHAACQTREIPPASALTTEAWSGRSCFACGRPLTVGAVHVGRAMGRSGVHDIGAEVFACP